MRLKSALTAICLSALAMPAFAQLPLRAEWLGSQSTPLTAEVIEVLGDINNDGVDDYVVGKSADYVNFGAGFVVGTGRSAVLSGVDGSILVPHWGPQLNSRYGAALAVLGDLNGDGYADFAAGAPGFSLGGAATHLGLVAFVSGDDGAVIDYLLGSTANAEAGAQMAALGDITGDGKIDLAYAERLAGPAGPPTIRIRSGANRSLIRSIVPSVTICDWTQPISLGNAGDVDNDGVNDLAVGIPGATPLPFAPNFGLLHVYSGATGAFITGFQGSVSGGRLGVSVQAVGDRNNDGHDDIAVGAPGAGLVQIISGLNGTSLQTLTGGIEFGRSLTFGRDLNGDGAKDLAVGALGTEQIVVFSGVDLSQLRALTPWAGGQVIGSDMIMIADINGDGMDEMVATVTGDLGQILAGLNVSGLAMLSIAGNREFGAPGGAQPLDLQWVDIPLADPSFGGFICSGATPFAMGTIGVSLAVDNTVVSGLPFSLPLYLAIDTTNLITSANFGFNGVGELIYPLALRNPVVAGTTFHLQVFQVSPPFGASNRLELLYTR